jgi:VWFA-related protein
MAVQPPTFRSGVDLVQLDVSIIRDGRPVTGLTAGDFIVTDNGAPHEVTSATLASVPLDVTLVLDVSESVSGRRLENLTAATDGLTRVLGRRDRAALMTFAHEVRLRVPLTPDMARIRSAMAPLTGTGATALRDAVALAIAMRPDTPTRSLLLLFSDGLDTASWVTEQEVLEAVHRSAVVIHAVRLERDRFLDRLAAASGGRTWSATSDADLETLFTRAIDEMRARYLLTYSPPAPQQPGWHEIKVSVRAGAGGGRGSGGEVTARPGYFVAPRPGP